ncbi:AsmA family protein [Hyphomicrobium sp. GJ21]|uniref:AsmA family protein n=1 Tax=Hyphomicrobium sp. GJ21 TaxID=113574 RepID=UPI000622BF47|nr:AsmA family protein [Hyphomicrobium sp. GJ21]CEJ87813.1 AsmA family protein [Hyphomicrobium sp. GJ21]
MAPQPPGPPPQFPGSRGDYVRAPLGSGPRRRPPPPPPPRRNGLLLGIVYFFLFVLLVGGAGVAYLAFNPPSDFIRQRIADEVRSRTGRELVMAGPASFTFYPAVGISLKDVSLSGPPGMDGKLAQMQALDVSINASALLSRRAEIQSLVLRNPTFDFRIDKDGRKNWRFASGPEPVRYAELQAQGTRADVAPFVMAAADAAPAAQSGIAIHDLKLDDVRIEGGTFRFTDERSGRTEQVHGVNAKLGLPSLSKPLTATGQFAWHDKLLNFDGSVSDVGNFKLQQPAHLKFKAKNDVLAASYDGSVTLDEGVALEGQVNAQSDSARALAQWFGTRLPPVSGFGPLSIQGTLKTSSNVTDFQNAQFGLDGAVAKGTIRVTTGGVRPFVEADLAISELDLNHYLTSAVTGVLATESAGEPDRAPASAPPANANSGGSAKQPDEIEKLLNAPAQNPGAKVYGAVQRAGWSSEKLNLTLLNVADGNIRASAGKIHFKNMTLGRSSVAIAVKDAAMRADFNDVELYQGRGKGRVTLDGSTGSANLAANVNLQGVSALPFLRDAANFEWLSGKANVALNLTANGQSQLQLVENLNGNAAFRFADGAVVGFNLPGALHGLANGDFSGLKKSPSEKTDFSALAASFTVVNGVAQNQDLQLLSPLLRVSGAGIIHMPERTVDYTVKPKLVASLVGQDGNATETGIEVPVRISGSWDRPSYRPDLKGVLSDPGKAVDTIKELGKKYKGKSVNEIADDLLGKDDGDASGDKASTKKAAKNLLNKLFGKQQE